MRTTAPHAIQPERRHGGARPGAGAPRGPRQATRAWRQLVAICVAREVGEPAFRLMPHHRVLLLAARIFMCDGDFILAERAFREAGRLFRKGARRSTPTPFKSAATHAPSSSVRANPRARQPDPTQFKSTARQRSLASTTPRTQAAPLRQRSDPTQFKTAARQPSAGPTHPSAVPLCPQHSCPTQFRSGSPPPPAPRPRTDPAPVPNADPTVFKFPTFFKFQASRPAARPASPRPALLRTTPFDPLPTPFLGVLPKPFLAFLHTPAAGPAAGTAACT